MTRRLTDAETAPIMLAAGLKPLEPYPGNHAPWRCTCMTCGQERTPRYANIQQGWGGCSVCVDNEVYLEIVIATMAAAGLEPLVPYPGLDEPWPCLHKCGNEVRPHYHSIQRGGGGCRFCTPRKYDPSRPGCVYLIEFDGHPDFPRGVIKIGMTGGGSRRLDRWQRLGWTLLEVFHCEDGKIPPVVEREVLKWLNEDLGLEPCLSSADLGGRSGHTETVSVADLTRAGVTVADVRNKVKQLVKKQSRQVRAISLARAGKVLQKTGS